MYDAMTVAGKWKRYGTLPVIIMLFAFLGLAITFVPSETTGKNAKLPEGWTSFNPPQDAFALAAQGDIIWAGGTGGVYKIDRRRRVVTEKLKPDFELNYVKALLVDKEGVLWIGNNDGLTRYDGRSFYKFTVKDGLPDNRVNALALDLEEKLWIGTWKGAARKEGARWTTIRWSEPA